MERRFCFVMMGFVSLAGCTAFDVFGDVGAKSIPVEMSLDGLDCLVDSGMSGERSFVMLSDYSGSIRRFGDVQCGQSEWG